MKKLSLIFAVTLIVLVTDRAAAQNSFSALIKSGPADATKLLDAYAEPLFKGLGVGLNSGWNNTAKTKKLLQFDFRFSGSVSFVPTSDKTFDVTKIGLSNSIRPADATKTIAPTLAGNSTTGPLLNIYDSNNRLVGQFNTPGGKISVIPAPQFQMTVGLIQNTDVTIRAIPSVSLGSDIGTVSSFGFGIKHDILQDFAGKAGAKLIPFNLAIAFGYSHLNLSVPLTVNPDPGSTPASPSQPTDFSNQHLAGTFNSFMVQAIFSKKIAVFTPFISVGYNQTQTNAAAVGNYPVTTGGTFLTPTYTVFTNPINISETSISGVRADVGFQLNAGFFRFYASYSAAQYQSVNGGVGFGF